MEHRLTIKVVVPLVNISLLQMRLKSMHVTCPAWPKAFSCFADVCRLSLHSPLLCGSDSRESVHAAATSISQLFVLLLLLLCLTIKDQFILMLKGLSLHILGIPGNDEGTVGKSFDHLELKKPLDLSKKDAPTTESLSTAESNYLSIF